jgi:FkbM family methyltransferase
LKNKWRRLSTDEQAVKIDYDHIEFGTFAPNILQKFLIYIGQNSFLKRGLFRSKYSKMILSIKKGPLDIYFKKCAFRIFGENNLIEYGILLVPNYNGLDLAFLLEGSDLESNFVDLGSNIGLYSQPLALASPLGKVLAIDANPLMKSKLLFNFHASKINNIEFSLSAVSDKIGKGSLKIRKNDIAIVALDENIKGNIEINTLQNLISISKIKSIHGLKIDIEGHEDKALVPFLLNAPKALLPKKIVIEKLSKESDYPGCNDAFKKLNYKLVKRSKNNSFYELNTNAK